jgi:hypothetical protein
MMNGGHCLQHACCAACLMLLPDVSTLDGMLRQTVACLTMSTTCSMQPGSRTAPITQVVFYDPKTGREQAAFDQGGDNGARSFGCAAMNPAGDAAVVGGFNRLYIFARGGPKGLWQPAGVKQVRSGGDCARGSALRICSAAKPHRCAVFLKWASTMLWTALLLEWSYGVTQPFVIPSGMPRACGPTRLSAFRLTTCLQ